MSSAAMAPPLPQAPDGSVEERLRRVKLALFFPFGCYEAIKAHDACLAAKGHWEPCTAARDAMDDCVESGEKRRFYLESQCSRLKRVYQSCLLSSYSDCERQLLNLDTCIANADAEAATRRRRPPRPAYGIGPPVAPRE